MESPNFGARRKRIEPVVSGSGGSEVHVDPATILVEADFAVAEREQRPIAGGADVGAGDEAGAVLADDDAAGGHELATECFYAEALTVGITTIT